ncbi:MAG: hypothetical protein ACM3WS_00950 [Bacillota bacterium]
MPTTVFSIKSNNRKTILQNHASQSAQSVQEKKNGHLPISFFVAAVLPLQPTQRGTRYNSFLRADFC